MAQNLLEGFDGTSLLQKPRSEGVSKGVEIDVLKVGFFQKTIQISTQSARFDEPAHGRTKNQVHIVPCFLGLLPLPFLGLLVAQKRRIEVADYWYLPPTATGLGRCDAEPRHLGVGVFDAVDRALDCNLSFIKINAIPGQCHQFTAPETGA